MRAQQYKSSTNENAGYLFDQDRNKRKPVRIPVRITAPANTGSSKKPTQDPLQMILNVLRQKLSYLNIF